MKNTEKSIDRIAEKITAAQPSYVGGEYKINQQGIVEAVLSWKMAGGVDAGDIKAALNNAQRAIDNVMTKLYTRVGDEIYLDMYPEVPMVYGIGKNLLIEVTASSKKKSEWEQWELDAIKEGFASSGVKQGR